MACKFIYKGNRVFNSEIALDEFLINSKKYLEGSDIVFELSTILKQRGARIKQRGKAADKLITHNPVIFDTDLFEDYEMNEFGSDNYGVTFALKLYVDAEGHPLFPIFNLENYWQHKMPDWLKQEYWTKGYLDDTGEVHKCDKYEYQAVWGDKDPNDITAAPTNDLLEVGKKVMERVWPMQGFMGTGVHRMIAAYWKCLTAHKGRASATQVKAEMTKALDFQLIGSGNNNPLLSEFKGIKYSDFLSDKVDDTYSKCRAIHDELNSKFLTDELRKSGMELYFLPETAITTEVDDFEHPDKKRNLLGNVDLFVIDPSGNIHIIDYKTSPKEYNEYNSAKIRTFYYLLATYRRLTERMGFALDHNSNVYVIPIKFENFLIDPEQTDVTKLCKFDNLKLREGSSGILERLEVKASLSSTGVNSDTINSNLDKIIPIKNTKIMADGDILDDVKTLMKAWFPSFGKYNEITKEYVVKMLKRKGRDKINPNSLKYTYKVGKKTVITDSFEALVDGVYLEYLKMEEHVMDRTLGVKTILQEAINNKENVVIDTGYAHSSRKFARESYLENLLNPYTTGEYEILDDYNEATERLGIILLKNIHTNKIDVLVVDTSKHAFDDEIALGGTENSPGRNKTLTGTFISDVTARNKPNELVLDSTYGNIRMMEVMLALNNMSALFNSDSAGMESTLGEIKMFNQFHNDGWTASNEQLLYNFKELHKANKTEDLIHLGKDIKMCSLLDLIKHRCNEIMANPEHDRKWNGIQTAIDNTQNFTVNPIILKSQLIGLAHDIEEKFKLKNDTNARNLEGDKAEAYSFLANLYSAIAEIDGIHFKLQIKDHSAFLNLSGVKRIFKEGWSGNSLDNPGMLDSDTLNKMGQRLNEAYLLTRDEIQNISKKIYTLSKKLKEENNFGYLKSRTIGNEASIYKNLYDDTYEDDLVFKNPFDSHGVTLSETEKEFLKQSLLLINHNRYGDVNTMDDLELAIMQDPYKYLRVPLTEGTNASKVAYKGMWETIKEKFKNLIPTKLNMQRMFKGLLVDETLLDNEDVRNKYQNKDAELWEMNTAFDAGETELARKSMLANYGKNYFEHNLELLTMKHAYAYTLKNNINKIFPLFKACALQLEMGGAIMNTRFAEDILYLHDFITNKVLNMSILDPKWRTALYVCGNLMSGASKLALAFNPKQFYQAIDGLWKDISLVIRQNEYDQAFSQLNMKDSFWWVYRDLTHNWGDGKSLALVLNELYGINDMDMNSYIDKTKPNQFGIFNLDNVMFHFASRPDFYNRMTIFGAQMRHDGCFEAHDEDGTYHWEKDLRYNIYAKYCKDESAVPASLKAEYNKQKARYKAAATQFQAEGAKFKNSDGEMEDFVVDLSNPKPLPRAYTVKEAESIKSLADLIYGYYSHEKKSMIQSTTAGALFMQMNTFWSSKKNLWFLPGGVRMLGTYEHYSETLEDGTKKYYYQDENGNITDLETDTPFMVWKGRYLEGIMVTLANIFNDTFYGDETGKKGLGNAIDKYWNATDENLRNAYRNNLKLLLYDLLMFLFLGMLIAPALENAAKAHAKEVGNGDLGDAMINNATVNLTSMLSTSTDDFNALKSIFGRGVQWTPFSISTLTNSYLRVSSAVSGNSDWYDAIVKMSAAGRTLENMFDYIKINTLGRKIGDNGVVKED